MDVDPVAIAHSKAILAGQPDIAVVEADLRDPEKILASPEVGRVIDFSQPAGLLLVAVLHFIASAADPWRLVATLRDALAPGSYLILGQATSEGRTARNEAFEKMYNRSVATSDPPPLTGRDRALLRRLPAGQPGRGVGAAVAARLTGRRA